MFGLSASSANFRKTSELPYDQNVVLPWGRRGRDRMVVGINTIYAVSAYHH